MSGKKRKKPTQGKGPSRDRLSERITVRTAKPESNAVAALLTEAHGHRSAGRPTQAVDLYRTVIAGKTTPDQMSQAQSCLGHALRALGRVSEAVPCYQAALQAKPEDAETLYQLGAILLELKEEEQALAVIQKLEDLTPDHPRPYTLRGLCLKNRGDLEGAVVALEKARAVAPDDLINLNLLMMTLHGMKRFDEARKVGQEALVQKDLKACEVFATKPQAQLSLTLQDKPFDPHKPSRNIIAFSLWGDNPDYTHGAIVNARIAPHIYMGWSCRFYCDSSVPEPVRAELKRLGAQVTVMPEPNQGASGLFWRFSASDDPNVDRFLCRDCDSRPCCQEAVAVDQWCQSDKPFHVMRDHIFHNELILAGMWGGVAGVLPSLEKMGAARYQFQGVRHGDQNFLREVVWPLIKNDLLTHDSQYHLNGSIDYPPYGRLPHPYHVAWSVRHLEAWKPGM